MQNDYINERNDFFVKIESDFLRRRYYGKINMLTTTVACVIF